MTYTPVGKSNILMPVSSYWNVDQKNPVYKGRNISPVMSPDAELIPVLGDQHASSSDLVKNEPISSAAISTMVHGTVGSGMRPESQIDFERAGISEQQAADLQKQVEFLFKFMAASEWDISKNYTFWDVENLLCTGSLEFGDAYAIKRFDPAREVLGLSVQLIEGSRVKTPPEHWYQDNIRAGVRVDKKTGERKSIFIQEADEYGSDYSDIKFKEVQIRDKRNIRQVLIIEDPKRIGQSRGIPYLSVITNIIKQLGKYSESEVTAAVFNSFVAFVTQTDDGINPMPNMGFVSEEEKRDPIPSKIEPWTNYHIKTNEKINMLDPNRPNKNFDSFFLSMMKLIGAQLQIPAQVLLMQFDASYSASIAAVERAFEVFKIRRQRLVCQFHSQVWRWFWDEAVLRDYLKAPGYLEDPLKRAAYQGCVWVGDPCLQLDRWKAAKAARELYDLGIISKKTLTQMLTGQNFEQVVAQRARENAMEPQTVQTRKLTSAERKELEDDEDN